MKADIRESGNFENQSKREIIERFGVPDATFVKEDGAEYWLYASEKYAYVLVFGKKEIKGLVLRFEDGLVRATRVVNYGELEEIATRGWEYLDLLTAE